MAILIPAYGERSTITGEDSGKFSLAQLRAVVGGYIEIVNLRRGLLMICNEDGKRLQLPVNEFATQLYRFTHPGIADVIVGDVLVARYPEEVD